MITRIRRTNAIGRTPPSPLRRFLVGFPIFFSFGCGSTAIDISEVPSVSHIPDLTDFAPFGPLVLSTLNDTEIELLSLSGAANWELDLTLGGQVVSGEPPLFALKIAETEYNPIPLPRNGTAPPIPFSYGTSDSFKVAILISNAGKVVNGIAWGWVYAKGWVK